MPGTQLRQNVIAAARSVVVKVGTDAITDDAGRPDRKVIHSLARQVAEAMEAGVTVTLVASGAIGAGVGELELPGRPKTLPKLQAAAAVGQGQLMRTFHDAFARHGVRVGQVLVTRDDFENRPRYLNIRNTLAALAEMKALPIVNENDAVAVDEIRYGDNDIIAALVATMLWADLLVLLTVVDGVLRDGKVVDLIDTVDEQALSLAGRDRSRSGSGGMSSKLSAAGMVVQAGEAVAIANARTPNVLRKLLAGKRVGTVFVPSQRKMSSRKRWIGQAARPAGKLTIDDGAVRALTGRGKSLLPSGITAVSGRFAKGDTVSIVNAAGTEIARGLTNYSAEQVAQIKGLKTSQVAKVLGEKPYDEVVHRNNMTLP
jgi:glutamate 5-kinase